MTQPCIGIEQAIAWEQKGGGEDGYVVRTSSGGQTWETKDDFESKRILMGEGNDGTHVTHDMVGNFIAGYQHTRMGSTTIVQATLRNGFTILESSACVDPSNYDHQVGMEKCLERIYSKVWEFLGFLLATARNGVNLKFEEETPGDVPADASSGDDVAGD